MNEHNAYPEPERGFPQTAPAAVLELPGAAVAKDLAPPSEGIAEPANRPAAAAAMEAAPAAAQPLAKGRPNWAAPIAVGVIGLIAVGSLGALLYVNTSQRDQARHQLAVTTATLTTTKTTVADTQRQLIATQADSATRAVTAKYVAMYVRDAGKVNTDGGNIDYNCGAANFNFGACRTAMQIALSDLQAFQADRSVAKVPDELSVSDGQLKDALSAGIAAAQELIAGVDGDKADQVKDGYGKFAGAMVAIGKAESALAAGLGQ